MGIFAGTLRDRNNILITAVVMGLAPGRFAQWFEPESSREGGSGREEGQREERGHYLEPTKTE